MARPRKWRRVCCMPSNRSFGPVDISDENIVNPIVMSVDEYETIRLIDYELMTQLECSNSMNVARTTVQGIYIKARKKLACSLINGRPLVIEGGDYKLCETNDKCGKACWKKQVLIDRDFKEDKMIIAIPVEEKSLEASIYNMFGRAPYFLIYNNETKEAKYIENPGVTAKGGAGIVAAQTIVDNGVKVLIAPRCGQNVANTLEGNTAMYEASEGNVQANIDAFNKDELKALSDIHEGFHGHAQ